MLRKIRTVLAAVMFMLVTLLFVDVSGVLHHWLSWLAEIQLWPALLALNAGVIVALVVVTLVFGRIYCSVICPLGIMQDAVSHVSSRHKRNRFRYSPEKKAWRYGFLAVFLVAFAAGIGSLVALLAPYSSYGRMAENLLRPLWGLGNNLLAAIAERLDSYAFYSVDVWVKSLPTFIIAAVSFVVIGFLAWRGGRTYCNTVCPVGTMLSFLARFSWLKVHIDTGKCNACGLCARNCKASCIDSKNHRIDYSRCVVCGDCIDKCHQHAITFRHGRPQLAASVAGTGAGHIDQAVVDSARRSFLLGVAMATTSAALAQEKKKVDGGLAVIEDKVAPERATPITPPGSLSAQPLHRVPALRVAVPQRRVASVYRASVNDAAHGVLRARLLPPGVHALFGGMPHRGHPAYNQSREIVGPDRPRGVGTQELRAAYRRRGVRQLRHCPAGAITMVSSDPANPAAPKIPAVNEARCIGCGACENLCPARPFSAIYVEGHEQHRVI